MNVIPMHCRCCRQPTGQCNCQSLAEQNEVCQDCGHCHLHCSCQWIPVSMTVDIDEALDLARRRNRRRWRRKEKRTDLVCQKQLF